MTRTQPLTGVHIWEGSSDGQGLRFGIVVSQFNRTITDALLNGTLRTLDQSRTDRNDIEIAKVPGAFEIPGIAKRMASLERFDAVICLGAVIQGETPHFHYICSEVSRSIAQLTLDLELPVIFGILTTDSIEQAVARSGEDNNKGSEAAIAAIEMAHLYKDLK
ncbi:6,7-dimethyl-8-ribityllumazine synthase [Nitrospira defluvii]|nr:6,7-dimethyl-8-ribityllumazine synthase [Nitrospira defluvii]